MKSLLIFATTILLVGCFSSKKSIPAVPPTATNPPAVMKEISKDVAAGGILYNQYCGRCHNLKDPEAYSAKEWKEIVPNMVSKSNNKKGTSITAAEQNQILAFVLSQTKR